LKQTKRNRFLQKGPNVSAVTAGAVHRLAVFFIAMAALFPQPAKARKRSTRVAHLETRLERLLAKQQKMDRELVRYANKENVSVRQIGLLRWDIKRLNKFLAQYRRYAGNANNSSNSSSTPGKNGSVSSDGQTGIVGFFISPYRSSYNYARRRRGRIVGKRAYAWLKVRFDSASVVASTKYHVFLMLRGSRRHGTVGVEVMGSAVGTVRRQTQTIRIRLKRPPVKAGTYEISARISLGDGSSARQVAAKSIHIALPKKFVKSTTSTPHGLNPSGRSGNPFAD
jgi:hypothetical protein